MHKNESKALEKILNHAHEVSFWVATTIVKYSALADRVRCARAFLTLADMCLDKGNCGTAKVCPSINGIEYREFL